MSTAPITLQAYGLNQAIIQTPQPVIVSKSRAPLNTDKAQIGTLWVYTATNSAWILTSIVANVATWEAISGSGAGVFGSLTVTPGPTSLTGALTVASAGNAVNIATDAVANATTIGNVTGASSLTLNYGTGNLNISGSATSQILIGAAADTGNMVIGQSTAGQAISIGGGVNTGAQSISLGSGSSGANSTVNILTGNASAGIQTANILTGTRAGAFNLATGAAAANTITVGGTGANVIAIGNTQTAGSISLGAAMTTGTISIGSATSGLVSMPPVPVSAAATTVVNNVRVGQATYTGLTTASAATVTLTLTNSFISATSAILLTVNNVGSNDAEMTVQQVKPATGSATIILKNNGAAALNGNINIAFWVMN